MWANTTSPAGQPGLWASLLTLPQDHLAVTAGVVVLLGLLGAHAVNVRRHRFDRVREMERKYPHYLKDPSGMNYKDAADIMLVSQKYDMPWLIAISLSFALFKTYAVPTISKVLADSKQLLLPENATRRAEDTGVVIAEFLCPEGLDSERATTALARMNWLHRRYGKRITRDDMLYTLSLFIFEPIIFCEKFEWRPLTQMEQEARYVFWREVGARMGIADIPRTRQGLWDWQAAYAEKVMVYAESNAKVAATTTAIFLSPQPEILKPFAHKVTGVFLDELCRKAFGLPRSPEWMYTVVPALIGLRAWVIGHLMGPRVEQPSWQKVEVTQGENGKPRYVRQGYLFEPWYTSVKAPRLGLYGATIKPGKPFHPEGFQSTQLGPPNLEGQGEEATLQNAAEMRERAATCPFFM